MKKKRLKYILFIVAFILLIPLIAMQFTEEVNWNLFDFVVVGILLLGIGLIFDLVIRKISDIKYRIAIFIAILIILFLVWAELAVGIYGTPFAGS